MELATVQSWKDGAAPMAWVNGRIYFNRRRVANGTFDGWSSLPDGSDERCHTDIAAYPATTHAGIGDVTADGGFALVTVERANHWPYADGDQVGSPGRGTYNDLWIHNLATNQAWKIRDLLKTKTHALIWPRFSVDGNRVVWSELTELPFWPGVIGGLGKWRMHVATITVVNGVPTITAFKTKDTQGLMEAYGFSPDGSKVLFAGDKIVGQEFDATSICDMPTDLTGMARRLSPSVPIGWWNNYNEFAYYIPGTDRIMFARTSGGNNSSLEYWTMLKDGGDAQQLTHFSDHGHVQYQGSKVILGGAAFNPENPKQLAAGYALDLADTYKSVILTLA